MAQVSPESPLETGQPLEAEELLSSETEASSLATSGEGGKTAAKPLADSARLAKQIAAASYGMFAIYIVVVLAEILPPQLLDPAWQLHAAASFVNYLTIPLVGLVLFQIGCQLASRDPVLSKRRQTLRRLAAAAALGFLLLVPVQAFAVFRGMDNVSSQRRRDLAATDRMAQQLSEAITTATSTRDLRNRLVALRGPNIPDADLAQPLPVLQKQLLGAVQQIRERLKEQVRSQTGLGVAWPLLQQTARNGLICLIGAFAFASMAATASGAPLLSGLALGWKAFLAGLGSGSGGKRRISDATAESKKRQREIVAQRQAKERSRQARALRKSLSSLFSRGRRSGGKKR